MDSNVLISFESIFLFFMRLLVPAYNSKNKHFVTRVNVAFQCIYRIPFLVPTLCTKRSTHRKYFSRKKIKNNICSRGQSVLFMKQKSPLNVLYLWAWGTCGCWGHVGVGDMWVWGTCGCGGPLCVGD